MKTLLAIFALPVVFSAYGSVFAAGSGQGTEVPDFTQGAKIPDDAEHDWPRSLRSSSKPMPQSAAFKRISTSLRRSGPGVNGGS